MSEKSELMYRMDALAAAGLTGDMMALADTLTSKDGKPHLITSAAWLAIYNDNLTVRLAYDRDKYGEAYDREHGIEKDVTPKPAPRKITPVPLTPIQGNRILAPKQPEPAEERRPMATNILTATARNVAQFYRNPPVGEPKPEDAYVAWLLETLAEALEKADADKQQKE